MPRHSQVHFRLKKSSVKGKSVIYLQFIYQRRRLYYSTSQIIDNKDWSEKTQRVKQSNATTNDGNFLLNDLLKNLEIECLRGYRASLATEGVPAPQRLTDHLNQFIKRNDDKEVPKESVFSLIDRFITGEFKTVAGREKAKGTINNYKAVMYHLREFEKREGIKISFESINLEFFGRYTSFLKRNFKLSDNTIAKDIRILKAFMNQAVELGLTSNLAFRNRKFSYAATETDAIYLTEGEISALYAHDFSKNRKLDQVRDLFVFGCSVGLRFSDFNNVTPENIYINENGKLRIRLYAKKTKKLVSIPCSAIVKDIFTKYANNPNKLPKSISNQKFNEYIKLVCKDAGMTAKGRLSTDPHKELWECVSSHTCRRSFATNLYLAGIPPSDIRIITGHKTERAFLSYIKMTEEDAASRISAHFEKKEKNHLRVAG